MTARRADGTIAGVGDIAAQTRQVARTSRPRRPAARWTIAVIPDSRA
jgi:hypothetical protein